MHDDVSPTSLGLLRCLQALAEETAALGLTRTHASLRETIDACRAEAGLLVLMPKRRPQAGILH